MRRKALIITERRELYQQLIESLRNTCLEIDYAASYVQAVNRCSRFHYILIILDIHFSEMNGMAVVRRLRQLEQAPILVLSTCYSRQEEIEVLNAGADAYLPVEGPLDQELLLAHASALMRRYLSANTREYATIQIADIGLKINLNLRKAFLNGENLRLTPKQFDILQLLVDRIGEIVTKEELFEIAWKGNYDIYADDAIKYHIRELRKKLGQHGMAHLIETAWGVGYQICLENE
ncbi:MULTISPECIES: response regulator transcription factor [Oscillospiraceae]|uniref:response regulator transcription factor n=1 Tax=Oscillospiraceae TaxID=216572 RepID=UPI0009FB812F|nr:response regulator transcription factor [Oscillibacter sp. KLE 1745]